MEMSDAYLDETAVFLETKGYTKVTENAFYGAADDAEQAQCVRHTLRKGDEEYFILEVVTHPNAKDRYFLEIIKFHSLRSQSFPLDSWKFFPDRVEFKYYVQDVAGLGLSFVLSL